VEPRWVEVIGDSRRTYKYVNPEGKVVGTVQATRSYVMGKIPEAQDFYDVSSEAAGYLGEYLGLEAAKQVIEAGYKPRYTPPRNP
jgi:hypothetical protein